MATISEYPRGLMSLLGLQTFGENPRDLSGVIAPSLDLLQFFLFTRRESRTDTVSMTATGSIQFPTLIVPPGEAWFLQEFGIQVQTGAAQTCTFAPTINMPVNAYQMGDAVALPVSSIGRCFMSRPPLLLPPGTSFNVQVQSITGAPFNADMSALFTRLRV